MVSRLLRTMACVSTTTSTPLPVYPVSLSTGGSRAHICRPKSNRCARWAGRVLRSNWRRWQPTISGSPVPDRVTACQVRVEELSDDGRRDHGWLAPPYVDHRRRRHETHRRTDDRRHGEFNDFDASGDSGTVFYLEAFDIASELLAYITSSDKVDPPALALPVGHHVQLKNGPSGSTNRASELILFPSSKIAPGDPSSRHKAARHTIGYCRSEKATWASKPPQIGQDTTCLRFREMHQRGSSPEAIERQHLKREGSKIGADQR